MSYDMLYDRDIVQIYDVADVAHNREGGAVNSQEAKTHI